MINEIRKQFKQSDDIRDKGLTTPCNINRINNIKYGNHPLQQFDIYHLKELKNKTLPVIVSIHGGAWVYGDKERYQYYCMELAKHGFAVINFSYRLAPEAKFPAALEDTNTVMHWIVNNHKEYQLDINNVFALGDSAGGHLLGLYSAMLTNREYAETYNLSLANIKLKAIAFNCAVYNVENDETEPTKSLMKEYLPNGGTKQELHHISPINFITKDFPPCFIMTCSGDFLKNAPFDIIPILTKNNIPFIYHYYTSDKKLDHVFHCNIRLLEAIQCNKEECDFFKSHIK